MQTRRLPMVLLVFTVLIFTGVLALLAFRTSSANVNAAQKAVDVSAKVNNQQPTPQPTYDLGPSNIGQKFITEDGMEVTFVEIVKQNSLWFFHIKAHNGEGKDDQLIAPEINHAFFIDTGTAFYQLTNSSDVNHPAPPAKLANNNDTDGWVVLDVSKLPKTPIRFYYRYRIFHTTKCTNPQDSTTCSPADLPVSVVWTI